MNLETLINTPLKSFFDTKINPSDIASPEDEAKVTPTTFRIPNDIKNYYQLMADASRNTLQGSIILTLRSLMNSHIIDQPAQRYANQISERFFYMFDLAGIPIRKIPKFLKDFNIKQSDLTSENRIVEMISDESIVDFLAQEFLINKEWIQGKNDISHKSMWLHKNTQTIQSLIQHSPYELNLKVLFDNNILTNLTPNNDIQLWRYVDLALI